MADILFTALCTWLVIMLILLPVFLVRILFDPRRPK